MQGTRERRHISQRSQDTCIDESEPFNACEKPKEWPMGSCSYYASPASSNSSQCMGPLRRDISHAVWLDVLPALLSLILVLRMHSGPTKLSFSSCVAHGAIDSKHQFSYVLHRVCKRTHELGALKNRCAIGTNRRKSKHSAAMLRSRRETALKPQGE